MLGRRDFRRLLVSRATSQLADGFFQAALALSAFFNPGKEVEPVAYAIAFTILIAPYSVLGPYVGVFLDRWSRRNVLAICNTARALLVAPAAVLLLLGQPEWQWAIFAMLVITINRFVLAGLSASQPHTVNKPELVTANAFATTMGTICFGAGLGASLLVIQLLGGGAGGYAAGASLAIPLYAASAAVAWLSYGRMDLGPDESERVTGRVLSQIIGISRGMVHGFRHLWIRRGSLYMMFTQACHRALYGVVFVLTLALLRGHFHDPGLEGFGDTLAWAGAAAAAGQVGSFLAAVITPKLSRAFGPGTLVTGLLAMLVLVLSMVGTIMVEVVFVVATFLVNITSQGLKITTDTSLQLNCDDEYRGRLFSLNDTVYNIAYILGMFVCVLFLPSDGYAPWILFAAAGGYAVLSAWYWFVSRRFAAYAGIVP
ncbi:MFS transporter [Stackebrandtia albiflava]|uniref:MFS transporter n=2 Tax=Stackebrandtia albiflava TaxID=406432 RepID=A0A562V1R1_9ACTN|nr:MFS transporter [Stackebrandtia albiflava]